MRIALSIVIISLTFVSCSGGQPASNRSHQIKLEADSVVKPKLTTLHFAVADKPCIAVIDTRYKDYKHKAEFPLSLFITVTTEGKDRNGHPTEAEAKVHTELEEELSKSLGVTVNAFIGKTTMNGYRDYIYYIKPEDRDRVTAELQSLKKKYSRLKEFTFEDDPQWEAVAEFYEAVRTSN